MSAVVATKPVTQITLDQVVDILDSSTILDSIDIGNSLIYRLNHPKDGNMVLVNAGDKNAVVYF